MANKFLSGINVTGTTTLNTVANAGTDTDKFLVLDASGNVDFRTGDELYADLGIGSLPAGFTSTLKHAVKAGVALTKGQAVYVTSADGTNMIVGKASNASEATSSKTLGLIETGLSINGIGNVITEGLLAGLDTTGAAAAGDPVWLGTDGNLIYGLLNKPYAPAHLVFIGVVTRRNANNGEIFVKVQNGFELNEIHDVDLKTTTPIDGHILGYDGTLWVNKTIAGWLGYTPVTNARTLTINGTTYDLSADRSWTIEAGGGSSASTRVIQKFTSTAAQTTFTITGGYTVGMVDVWVNGVKLDNAVDFTASNGTTVVLTDALTASQIVEVYKYGSQFIVNNGLRQKTLFTATAGQTTFTVAYSVGLVDVYYNGSKLDDSEFTATNGTSIVLGTACAVNDKVEVIAFSYNVNGFTGIGGSGTINNIPKFTAAGTIGDSAITDNGTTVTLVSRALSGTSATFTSGLINGTTDAFFDLNRSASGNAGRVRFQTAGTDEFEIGLKGGVAGFHITKGDATELLTIATTGAATFSSTSGIGATIIADWNRSLTNDSQLYIKGATNGNKQLRIGYDTTGNVGYIQALTSGTSVDNLLLNPSGGNVGIGHTPSYTLDILSNQSNAFRILQNINGDNYININNTSTGTAATSRMDIGVNSGSYALTIQKFGLNFSGTLFGVSCTNSSAIYDNSASSNGLFIGAVSSTPIIFGTSNAERMRITSSGNVGIGTSSPQTFLHVLGSNTSGRGQLCIQSNNASNAAKATWYYDTTQQGEIGTTGGDFYALAVNNFPFYAGGSERMRITSGGYLKASPNGSYFNTNASFSEFCNNITNGPALFLSQTSTSFVDNALFVEGYTNTTNNTWYLISGYNRTAGAYKFRVADSGNVTNTNNSYGAISDIKLKENIVDASPKLNDLLKVKIKNFNYIGSEEKQLGVIAQELEEVFPSMIEVHNDKDGEGNDLGSTTKSVKYSVFIPMLIKAIQEQQSQIEELKAMIAAK